MVMGENIQAIAERYLGPEGLKTLITQTRLLAIREVQDLIEEIPLVEGKSRRIKSGPNMGMYTTELLLPLSKVLEVFRNAR